MDYAHEYISHLLSVPPVTEIFATLTQLKHLESLPTLKDIASKYQTEITSDNTNCSIRIKGEYSKLKETRKIVILALQTLFPSEYCSFPVPLYFLQDLASHTLDETLVGTGAKFELDLPLGCVLIRAEPNTDAVMVALNLLKKKQLLWSDLHPVIPIEDYLLPSFVGKNGTTIVQMEKDLGVRIRVNRIEKRLEIENSDNKQIVSKAYEAVSSKVEKMRASHWEVTMTPEMLGAFIGKDGVNIKKYRADTNCNIDIDNKTEVLRVTGEPHCVADAKAKILEFIREEEKSNSLLEVSVPPLSYPVIIGTKGSIAKEIQTKTGCRLELDRNRQIVILRGSAESCDKASVMIQSILKENGFNMKVDEPAAEIATTEITEPSDASKTKLKVLTCIN